MKPVNLLPGDSAVVAVNAGKPNVAALGGAAFGFLAIVAVSGYFAMARVDSVKSETAAITARAAEATTETGAVNSQVASLGQPVVDSDKELARGQEAVLVAAYTERHDFPELAAELQGIMEGTGGWYVEIKASSAGPGSGGAEESRAVVIKGIMPTEQLAAAFEERASATRTLANAEITELNSTTLTTLDSKRNAVYWKFTIEADLVDTVAPSATGSTGGASDGTTVGEGGGSGELTLSLDAKPKPKPVATKPAKPAKPKNPFDVAASAAVRGGGA
ncbi:MAG: hypothetical protein JWL76_60 [Thermoleophilia bacterium]|nr:hypothetical protein [Thermoleophilia bacterium]